MSATGKKLAQLFAIFVFIAGYASCAQGSLSFAGSGDSGTGMTDTSPGVAVTLEYTWAFEPADIVDIVDITFTFEAGSWLDRLHFCLSTGTEFTIDDIGNRRQVTWNFYDPAYIDPDTIHYEYQLPITQALKDELMDGVFSANIWIENDQGDWGAGSTWWNFTGTVAYNVVPEPTTLGIVSVGGLWLLRKRK